MLPDGSPDPDVGEYFDSERYYGLASAPGVRDRRYWAVTTDRRNRVILAGSSLGLAKVEGASRLAARGFAVERLNAAGKTADLVRRRRRKAKARFGKRTAATADAGHIDSRGRIVLGGAVETVGCTGPSTGYGLLTRISVTLPAGQVAVLPTSEQLPSPSLSVIAPTPVSVKVWLPVPGS